MYRNQYPGEFIVFEGLDGSGQSTQAELLGNYLIRQGREVFLTKEPTQDSQAGKQIRRVLRKEIKIGPDELQKLFIQDRREHLEKQIIPHLKKGFVVISDRYFLSTCAFGGIDLDIEWLIELNNDFVLPDIIFFLDVSPEICLERIGKRGMGFQYFEEQEKLAKVRQNYLKLIKRFPEIYLINGELSREKVFKEILEKLPWLINKSTI